MAVFMCTARIHTIVDMKNGNLGKSDHFVKLLEHALIVMHQIISRIMYMTGIKTDSETIFFLHAVKNHPEFLKGPSDLTAFSRHCLERDQNITVIFRKYCIQPFHKLRNTGLCSRP